MAKQQKDSCNIRETKQNQKGIGSGKNTKSWVTFILTYIKQQENAQEQRKQTT